MSVEPRYEPIGAPHRAPGEPHHRGMRTLALAQPPVDGDASAAPAAPRRPDGESTSGVAQCGLGGDGQLHRRHPVQRVPHHDRLARERRLGRGSDVRSLDDGLPLTGEHIHAPCVACHNATRAISARARAATRISTATSFAIVRHVPLARRLEGDQALEIHRMTRFPLTGMHVLADCSECHVRASENRSDGCAHRLLRVSREGLPEARDRARSCGNRDESAAPTRLQLVPSSGGVGARGCDRVRIERARGSRQSAACRAAESRRPISHRVRRPPHATCDDCHASGAVARAVRCVGCHAHDPVRLAQQHRQPIATDGHRA